MQDLVVTSNDRRCSRSPALDKHGYISEAVGPGHNLNFFRLQYNFFYQSIILRNLLLATPVYCLNDSGPIGNGEA
jgi:hypothetical protein